MMRIALAFAFALSALATPVIAADLPVKAPPAPPAPVYAWTGCYIGGNIGWVEGRARFRSDAVAFSIPGGGASTLIGVFDDGSVSRSGFAGGGQIGCDYQFNSNWLIGVRGLVDVASFSGDHISPVLFDDTFHTRSRWFGTITGRLGYLITPTFLIYAEGGWGFVQQRFDVIDTAHVLVNNFDNGGGSSNGADVGVGFEWMFTQGWSLWVEWDHIFLNNRTFAFTIDDWRCSCTATVSESIRRDFDKVLVGINWRFGSPATPVRAAY
jgi:outer membrane immunogenic protein